MNIEPRAVSAGNRPRTRLAPGQDDYTKTLPVPDYLSLNYNIGGTKFQRTQQPENQHDELQQKHHVFLVSTFFTNIGLMWKMFLQNTYNITYIHTTNIQILSIGYRDCANSKLVVEHKTCDLSQHDLCFLFQPNKFTCWPFVNSSNVIFLIHRLICQELIAQLFPFVYHTFDQWEVSIDW